MSARESRFESQWGSAQQGFTLVEMLVALVIFSLGALALLRLEGATVVNTARLQDQVIAQIVARNVAVAALTDPVAPSLGEARGEEVNAGRRWTWLRRTTRSPEPRLARIDISVADEGGATASSLTVFRPIA